MADYFTHFSCLLDVGTPERATPALDLLTRLHLDEEGADDPEYSGFALTQQDGPGPDWTPSAVARMSLISETGNPSAGPARMNGLRPRCERRTAMPDIICTTVYQFPELSDTAKEKPAVGIANSGPMTIGGMRSTRISSGSVKSSAFV